MHPVYKKIPDTPLPNTGEKGGKHTVRIIKI